MNVFYIKRSYDKSYEKVCCKFKGKEVGKDIEIKELVFSAKYIDNIFNLKNKYEDLKKKITGLKRDNKYITILGLNVRRIIYEYMFKFKTTIFNYITKRELYKNKIEGVKYIFSINIEQDKELKKIIQNAFELSGQNLKEYVYLGEYDKNLTKYIKEYRSKRKLDKSNIKIGMVYSQKSEINTNILTTLLEEYKVVDILEISKNISGNSINKDIVDKINSQTGASIDIVDINSKKVKEYNYIILIDDVSMQEHSKRLNKKAGIISILNTNADLLNTKIAEVNKMVKEGILDKDIVEVLRKDYGIVIFSKSLLDS